MNFCNNLSRSISFHISFQKLRFPPIDVYFYIKSNTVLEKLDYEKTQCEKALQELQPRNNSISQSNLNIYTRDKEYKDYYQKLEKYNTLNTNESKQVIESYQYNLDGRFRPCLLLSLILSVGMSIFFRIIVLGFRHRDVPSAILVIILHSLLPTYMNVCVVKMDTYLFDIRLEPPMNEDGTFSCTVKDISLVEQICSFKACRYSYGNGGCNKEQTEKIKTMQKFNRRAKQFDWLISSIILLFVLFNFFKYLDEKKKISKRLEKQQGYEFPASRKRQSIIHNSLLQLTFYLIALVSFPIMFSVPYWIHKFWEAQEIRDRLQNQENCDVKDYMTLVDAEVMKDELLNSIFVIIGCVLWISLILSAIYHLIRMVLFSNKTEPASIMCHY